MTDDRPRFSAPRLAAGVLRDLGRCAPQLVGYEILFRILSVVILGPLSVWLVAMLISSTGKIAISNEEIASFALSPVGMLALVAWGALSLAVVFAEQAGVIVIAGSAARERRTSSTQALVQTARALPRLIRLGLIQVLGYALAFLPFGLLGLVVYLGLLSGKDINYYLSERPPVFWIAVALGGVLALGFVLVAAALYVWWIFSLPILLFERKWAVAALKESRRRVRPRFFGIAGLLIGWLVVMAGITAAVGFVLDLVDDYVLHVAGNRLGLVIPTVGVLLALDLVIAAVLAFVGFSVNCILVTRLYRSACERDGIQMQIDDGREEGKRVRRLAKPSLRITVWLVAGTLLALTVVFAYVIVEAATMEEKTSVTAHRGSSRKAPENTISAIEAAIGDGADFAEIDVQETADGVIVVLHDSDLMRIAGVDKKIWEMRHEDLKQLDAGSWFSPRFRGERIPTLKQAIEVARGRIGLNIELKFNGHEKRLVERVVEIVRQAGVESQCVLSSLESEGVEEARRRGAGLKVGLIVFRSVGDLSRLDVDFLSVNVDHVTEELVRSAHRSGKELHVWTVNDRQTMASMLDLGVDNILTDEPETLVALLEERAALSNVERILLAFHNRLAR